MPRFQRPFVWTPQQMLDLFDSIENGFPIGSIMVWDTDLELHSLDTIAGMSVPARPKRPVSYVLDGHQRLSTLFGALARRPARAEQDPWWIYRSLGVAGGAQYQHWIGTQPPPATVLPMQAILRTMDFLAFGRTLSRAVDDVAECEALIDEAERVALRIKSYKVAVVRLVGGDLAHAAGAFSRLNSAGQHVTPYQMISALAYDDATATSLAERVAAIRAGVMDIGFGGIPHDTIFQSIIAVAGETDVTGAHWNDVARRMAGGVQRAVDDARAALARVLAFLRYEAGVPLAWLVPHQLHIVLLAAFFQPRCRSRTARRSARWCDGSGSRPGRACCPAPERSTPCACWRRCGSPAAGPPVARPGRACPAALP